MQRRVVILAAGAAAVAAGAIAVIVALSGPAPLLPAGQASAAAPTAVPTAQSATPDSSDAGEVAKALQRLSTGPDSLVAAQARDQIGTDANVAVPAGTTVAVEDASWAPDGLGGGTIVVELTPPGGKPTTYAAIMIREADEWKVLATFPLDEKGAR